jgi:hypothetical protein
VKYFAFMPRLFFFNPLFDLELGGHPVVSVEKSAREMSPLLALLGSHDDRVLLDVGVPQEHWDYLSSNGFVHALPLKAGESAAGLTAVPWGWNEQSLRRLASLGAACEHPDLAIVSDVNCRAWCAAFNRKTGTGVPGSRFCRTREDLEGAFSALAGSFPLVAKPAFGGAGRGFVRLAKRGDGGTALDALLDRGGCTLEPWCDRTLDVSTSCAISRDGALLGLRHYRCLVNRHGAFYGVACGHDQTVEPWRGALDAAARAAAAALSAEGYFGPASFDSFVYRDAESGGERLAAVIEVNGRHVMSDIAFAMHDKSGAGRSSLFRFLGRRFCALPETYDSWSALLGNVCYDRKSKTGVIPLSPLRVNHGAGWRPPARSAFFIAAEDETGVMELDERLLERCRKH